MIDVLMRGVYTTETVTLDWLLLAGKVYTETSGYREGDVQFVLPSSVTDALREAYNDATT